MFARLRICSDTAASEPAPMWAVEASVGLPLLDAKDDMAGLKGATEAGDSGVMVSWSDCVMDQ